MDGFFPNEAAWHIYPTHEQNVYVMARYRLWVTPWGLPEPGRWEVFLFHVKVEPVKVV